MWKLFRKKGLTEMRPYIPGEDLSGVSVSKRDNPNLIGGGGMIARDPKNPKDLWFIAQEYFNNNYEEASS